MSDHVSAGISSATWLRRAVYVMAPIASAVGLLMACGTDKPQASPGPTITVPPGTSCETPNKGCACPEPAEVVPCGEVKRTTSDGHVDCMMGHRTCVGTRWGACIGEREVTRSLTGDTNVGTRALGDGGKCGSDAGGPENACDPYCNGFVDDPIGFTCPGDGGLGAVDGGFGICPVAADGGSDAGGDGGGVLGVGGNPPTVLTTATGDSTCAPSAQAHGTACNLVNQFQVCQQDFRCDPTTLSCTWNGPNNYYDGNASGVDLTIGAGCENGTDHLPVCNRGSVAIGSGATVTVHLLNPAQYTSWNTGTCPTAPGAPSCSSTLGAPLNPGECIDVTGCSLGGDAYAVVNAGPTPIPEAAGRCANNAGWAKTSGTPGCAACGMCNTTLTGKVYDPSGTTGNNLPLAGITVLVPAGTPPVFADGVACDTCASLEGPSIVKAVTDATGSFTINGATPGPATTIIAQSGRWRRKIQLAVTACTANTPPAGTFRLPQSSSDGAGGQADIPKMAIATGDRESIECLFSKMGVANSEITSPTAATPGRIHMYKDKGMAASSASPAPSTLWASQAAVDAYTAVIFPCSAGAEANQAMTAAQVQFYADYTARGGHALANHHAADAFFFKAQRSPVFAGTASFVTGGIKAVYKMLVRLGTFPQQQFYDWLNTFGGMATYGAPYTTATEGVRQALVANASQTTVWLGGQTNNMWSGGPPPTNQDFLGSYSFEMGNVAGAPTVNADCGAPGGHGRVFFNGMHVSPPRGDTAGTFPGSCSLASGLTEVEKALEFHLFQLTACQLGGAPPPPSAPPLPTVTFTRDYQAVCEPGFRVKWAPFYWQGIFLGGTSIDFSAATADTQGALPAAPPIPAPPTTAVVATTGGSVTTPTWDCQGCQTLPTPQPVSVDSRLMADTGTPSKEWLRIYMKFNPTGTVSPILSSWRQVYDCVPAE